MAKYLLAALGQSPEQIEKTVATFVQHDADLLDRQQAVFRDEEKLVAVSREARAQLDEILVADAEAEGKSDKQAPEDYEHAKNSTTQ
jgi:glutathione-regulated potassium-efflux system protein KefB